MRRFLISISFFLALFFSVSVNADISNREDVKRFVTDMVDRHGFEKMYLDKLFSNVNISESIIRAISRPAEALPWYKYRPIFLQSDRVTQGVEFWKKNQQILEKARLEFGVPEEIVVAIIGVETRYGRHKGKYKVLESLATLSFEYPKRAKFFKKELEQFLLLAREQKVDPLSLTGSYAGAMGMPQFISSSYRHYAVDFDDDGKIDIWNNTVDVIGSVGNYFKDHGWSAGEDIIFPAQVEGDKYLLALSKGLKPDLSLSQLADYGIKTKASISDDVSIKFLEYQLSKGSEYWLALQNFYVITRYNHSAMYAMAVFQLAQQIKNEYSDGLTD